MFTLIFSSLGFAADKKLLSADEQKALCQKILDEGGEIDRVATMASNKLKDTLQDKNASRSDIIKAAEGARDATGEARKAYERMQLDMPDGMKPETESALNEYAYEMKLAYGMYENVYGNFLNSFEKDRNRKLDVSRTGEIYGHMGNAVQAEERAMISVGIE